MEFDLVMLVSGWLLALILAIAWAIDRFYRKEITSKEAFVSFIISWLDAYYDNPHIRPRINKFWESDIQPSITNLLKKLMGPVGNEDIHSIMGDINSWKKGKERLEKELQEFMEEEEEVAKEEEPKAKVEEKEKDED